MVPTGQAGPLLATVRETFYIRCSMTQDLPRSHSPSLSRTDWRLRMHGLRQSSVVRRRTISRLLKSSAIAARGWMRRCHSSEMCKLWCALGRSHGTAIAPIYEEVAAYARIWSLLTGQSTNSPAETRCWAAIIHRCRTPTPGGSQGQCSLVFSIGRANACTADGTVDTNARYQVARVRCDRRACTSSTLEVGIQ